MLTEADQLLIASAVNGAFSPAEGERIRLLFDQSREARQLYRALCRERDAVRNLATMKAPDSLLANVMARTATLNPFETIPSSTAPQRKPRRSRLHYAVVAFVIASFSAGVLIGVRSIQRKAMVDEQAQALPRLIETNETIGSTPQVVLSRIPAREETSETSTEPETPSEAAPLPQPQVRPPIVYGSPLMPPLVLDSVLVKLPLVVSMNEMNNDSVRKQVQVELSRGSQARIDLFANNSLRAAELLIATGRAAGVNILLDTAAQERLRHRVSTTWLIYTEALTPEDATRWLVRLAATDVFQHFHLPGALLQDARDLKDLIGLETSKASRPPATKPVSESTLKQISTSLLKEKTAILVSYLPSAARSNAAQSKAVKTWLDRRGEKKPGTVPLMIVVR